MCLKIQVLGTGVIPRGLGLAPRKEPFNADLLLIQTILASPCKFKVKMVHPASGQLIEVTRKNLKNLWDKYSNYSETPASVGNLEETGVDHFADHTMEPASIGDSNIAEAANPAKHANPVVEKVEEAAHEPEDIPDASNNEVEDETDKAPAEDEKTEEKAPVVEDENKSNDTDEVPVMNGSEDKASETSLAEDEIPVKAAEEAEVAPSSKTSDSNNTIKIPTDKVNKKKNK